MKQLMSKRELKECVGGPSSGGGASGGGSNGGNPAPGGGGGSTTPTLLSAILGIDPALSSFFQSHPVIANFLNSIVL